MKELTTKPNEEVQQIIENNVAPDFEFEDAAGNSVKLSSLRGKKRVVIYFYPKDFTPGCTTEATEFSRDYKRFKDLGIEIIGISPDDDRSHTKFKENMNIPYVLVPDLNNVISNQYGVYGLKSFMGRDYMGVNRTTFLIAKNGKILKVFRKVKPLGHSQEVIETFEK